MYNRQGFAYENAVLGFEYSPLLSVEYYALASQKGDEPDADLALSKWYLVGTEQFEKNEQLALTFAEKAARHHLPAAEFAVGYYRELGIGCRKSIDVAMEWYRRVSSSHDSKQATTD